MFSARVLNSPENDLLALTQQICRPNTDHYSSKYRPNTDRFSPYFPKIQTNIVSPFLDQKLNIVQSRGGDLQGCLL